MITIICGENTAASREYYSGLKRKYLSQGYEVRLVTVNEIENINQWLADSPSLFSQKRIFFCENLNRHIKRENKKLLEELKKIEKLTDTEFIDWEGVSAWELKLKKIGQVKEFKPDQSIFKLQESLFPGNKAAFLDYLAKVNQTADENYIFVMLVRYVRNLLVVKEGAVPAGMQSWQAFKLKAQASQWKTENLVNFYQALFKIEISSKTSSNPFSVKESLDILACHFL